MQLVSIKEIWRSDELNCPLPCETQVEEGNPKDHWNVAERLNVVERLSFHGKTDEDSRHGSSIHLWHHPIAPPYGNPINHTGKMNYSLIYCLLYVPLFSYYIIMPYSIYTKHGWVNIININDFQSNTQQ